MDLVTLDEPTSRHLLKVLRLEIGAPLQLFNGHGGEYAANLASIKKNTAVIEVKEFSNIARESPLQIHLGQAISRGERMDYAIQKSVELGVSRITPLITERCGVHLNQERAKNRVQHWQKIAISACEQSGRCVIPPVENPHEYTNFLAANTGIGFICSPFSTEQVFPPIPANTKSITLIIGPEGGFTPTEVHQAQQAGFNPLVLGPRILRTETAPIVAITLLQSRWGDIK